MKKTSLIQLVTLILGIVWILLSNSTSQKPSSQTSATTHKPTPSPLLQVVPSSTPIDETNNSQGFKTIATVVKVVDGDTIDVTIDGIPKTVRYIGIDTPETVDPRRPVGCFGIEAKGRNKQLVENKIVTLEKDISETDKYGRLLRYVYIDDTFVNLALVSEGFANASSYPPDIKHQNQLDEAENNARSENKGLWDACKNNTSAPTPTPYINLNSCQYSCNGPDRDCSDFLSKTDAQTFFTCCGFMKENDPMNLDNVGIGDGIACGSR